MVEISALQDFMLKSKKYLEQMESGLGLLQQNPADGRALADLLGAVRGISSGCKELGLTAVTELLQKIEWLLTGLQQGKQQLTADLAESLVDTRTYLLQLVSGLERNIPEASEATGEESLSPETSPVAGHKAVAVAENAVKAASSLSPKSIDDRLKAGESGTGTLGDEERASFLHQTWHYFNQLRSILRELFVSPDKAQIFGHCRECLQHLQRVAQESGYASLAQLYEAWLSQLSRAQQRSSAGEEIGLEFMLSYVKQIAAALSHIHSQQTGPAEEVTTGSLEPAEKASETGSDTATAEVRTSRREELPAAAAQGITLEAVSTLEPVTAAAAASDATLLSSIAELSARPRPPLEIAPSMEKPPAVELFAALPAAGPGQRPGELPPLDAQLLRAELATQKDDPEFFAIFCQLVRANVEGIRKQLDRGVPAAQGCELLARCEKNIVNLKLSASLLGCTQLVQFHENWLEEIGTAKEQLERGESADMGFMLYYLDQINSFMPSADTCRDASARRGGDQKPCPAKVGEPSPPAGQHADLPADRSANGLYNVLSMSVDNAMTAIAETELDPLHDILEEMLGDDEASAGSAGGE